MKDAACPISTKGCVFVGGRACEYAVEPVGVARMSPSPCTSVTCAHAASSRPHRSEEVTSPSEQGALEPPPPPYCCPYPCPYCTLPPSSWSFVLAHKNLLGPSTECGFWGGAGWRGAARVGHVAVVAEALDAREEGRRPAVEHHVVERV